MPQSIELELGKKLQIRLRDGTKAIATVGDISEEGIILDANDPLAGQKLTFEIELLKIS